MTEAYPLRWPEGWPRTKTRSFGGFQVSPAKAMASLFENMRKLGVTHLVVSSNCKLRLDGQPYAEDLTAQLPDPGVAVYFQYRARPMVMAQDAYIQPFANIRSLALAIEAMRSIKRHGGGHMMQRSFDGFAQLPPPDGGATYTKRPWREVLEVGDIGALPAAAQIAIAEAFYKTRARSAHPDVAGGSAEKMAELNIAIEDARKELEA